MNHKRSRETVLKHWKYLLGDIRLQVFSMLAYAVLTVIAHQYRPYAL